MALKYAAKPVVSAPFARTLGGGCEIVLHSGARASFGRNLHRPGRSRRRPDSRRRRLQGVAAAAQDPRKVFELIGYAKVSSSAEDAKKLGLLRPRRLHLHEPRAPDRRRQSAGAVAGSRLRARRSAHRHQGRRRKRLCVAEAGRLVGAPGPLTSAITMSSSREKLANVLSGGRLTGEQTVCEQYLLDLEREAFLSLCGHAQNAGAHAVYAEDR